MKSIKLKLMKDFADLKAGDIVTIPVDDHNVPLDIYWRRRLRDSVNDGCVVFHVEQEEKKELKIKSKGE
jgi:hypothetical protein